MRLGLQAVLFTGVMALFSIIGSFSRWGAPSLSPSTLRQEREIGSRSISDLLRNRPPIFRKRVRQAWLYFAGLCLMLAAATCKNGHVGQYTMVSNPVPFGLYVAYWFALSLVSVLAWLRLKFVDAPYAAPAATSTNPETDFSPRKYGTAALVAFLSGAGLCAVDIHELLHDRAWIPFGLCRQRYCTFARADFPMGFWVSHAFAIGMVLMVLHVGVICTGKWWRASRVLMSK